MLAKRSIIREYTFLSLKLEDEFKGQVQMELDESNLNTIHLSLLPKEGPYAHGLYKFRLEFPKSYPNGDPKVTCLCPPFHPNIDPFNGLVCLNMLDHWSGQLGLKSLIHGLLFLFYEPNYDDPVRADAVKLPEGITYEEYVRLSLIGAMINDIIYFPNETWCAWAEKQNEIPAAADEKEKHEISQNEDATETAAHSSSSTTTIIDDEKKQPEEIGEHHTRRPSAISNSYFKRTLSTQFSNISNPLVDAAPEPLCHLHDLCTLCYEIMINRTDLPSDDLRSPWATYSPYYFTEICHPSYTDIFTTQLHVSSPTVLESVVFSDYLRQVSSTEHWGPRIPMYRSDDNQFLVLSFPDELNDQTPSPYDHHRPDLSTLFNEQNHSSNDPAESKESNAKSPADQDLSATNAEVAPDETVVLPSFDELARTQSIYFEPSSTSNQNEDDIEATILPDDQIEVNVSEFFADLVDGLSPVDSNGENESQETELREGSPLDDKIFDLFFTSYAYLLRRMQPRSWPFYRSRWPPFLVPGSALSIPMNYVYMKDFAPFRASTIQFNLDLLYYTQHLNSSTNIILVDPLTLWPTNPLLNRIFRCHGVEVDSVRLYCTEWISICDQLYYFRNFIKRPRDQMLFATMPFWSNLCLLSNWFAYFSRMELQSSSLQFSRPHLDGVAHSMALGCTNAATLGCGQTALFDAWPLFLISRSLRLLSSCWVYFCERSVRLIYPFSDIDQI